MAKKKVTRTKASAERMANVFRKHGLRARVIKTEEGYGIFTDGKRERKLLKKLI